MSWLEQKYVNLLGTQLQQFKQRGPDLWNFRCPYCNDSDKSKRKSRGYIYQKSGKYMFHCHNCSEHHNFQHFIGFINPDLYGQYKTELLENSHGQYVHIEKPKPIAIVNDPLKDLVKVSALPPSHSCKKYIVSRQIPTTYHYKLFYCEEFMRWTNTIIPGKFSDSALVYDKPRLVIPFLDKNNKMFGYQGRALDPTDNIRYISIMIDENVPKLFGLDTLDVNRRFYVLEGPIDSMFIDNAIAALGSRMDTLLDRIDFPKENCVIVYDNQPRNKDIIKNMLHAVRRGYNICIWPTSPDDKEDINDIILRKVSGTYVKTELVMKAGYAVREIIDSRVFNSLAAELEINRWKRA